ncbi:MAG TPA: DUF1572 family protein [Bryobacteraceae bacterium]|nr:DUF1572 family protein [Bryobacteraceae bacterium]
MSPTTGGLFLAHSINKLTQFTAYIEVCLVQLDSAQVWRRAGDSQNSIGNLILHLAGNVRQWICASIGGQPDVRQRDNEFAESRMETPQLIAHLNAAVRDALEILENLPPGRLTDVVVTQDGDRSVLEVIYQVVGHFQQHGGQIIYATKLLTGSDLKLYTPAAKKA